MQTPRMRTSAALGVSKNQDAEKQKPRGLLRGSRPGSTPRLLHFSSLVAGIAGQYVELGAGFDGSCTAGTFGAIRIGADRIALHRVVGRALVDFRMHTRGKSRGGKHCD